MPIARQNRRISIVLYPEVDAALSAISEFTGTPIAAIIRGMLVEAVPELQGTVKALRMVKDSPKKAAAAFVATVDKQIGELQQTVLPLRRKAGRTPGR
jgi:predicted DNA-binding protein